ncbi:HNH endonuclease [Butyrivibrio fibrisolvens]|uniref:HNH endonuclease n=1 Tax=Pseudobutyrivibrio ruminis TaxID=46206 RepID=UPI00041A36EC|nr:HNH endonuclease [Pseudobutyrivibrio ruminis]MDC7278051.1 HNH endonuclease [Butyrivibrio fibrisolvens]
MIEIAGEVAKEAIELSSDVSSEINKLPEFMHESSEIEKLPNTLDSNMVNLLDEKTVIEDVFYDEEIQGLYNNICKLCDEFEKSILNYEAEINSSSLTIDEKSNTIKKWMEDHPNETPSTYEERIKQSPSDAKQERGTWEGERGESKYIPNDESVKEILDKYGLDGITYKDGQPDFSQCSEGTVEIDKMTDVRTDNKGANFEQCDAKCADLWNQQARDGKTDWTADDVKAWRRENHYSWHERNDMKTCDLVPTKINDYFGHLGGVGECKKILRDVEDIFDA